MAPEKTGKARRARLALMLWLLIAAFYFYLATDYIRAAMADDALEQYTQFAVQAVGNRNRSPEELKHLVLARARELGIAVDPAAVQVSGRGHDIAVSFSYAVTIEVPLISTITYRREFGHRLEYIEPR